MNRPAANADPGPARRDQYRHFLRIPTRWMDNDIYGHVNNVVYYAYFDTVINKYLIEQGGLDIHAGDVIGYAVETQCRFRRAFAFPEDIEAGLRVGHLGNSSVRYEIGLFSADCEEASAEGYFIHVFVGRDDEKPAAMPPRLRAALQALRID